MPKTIGANGTTVIKPGEFPLNINASNSLQSVNKHEKSTSPPKKTIDNALINEKDHTINPKVIVEEVKLASKSSSSSDEDDKTS